MVELNTGISNFESIAVEITINNIKWILLGIYKPPSTKETDFMEEVNISLSRATQLYDRIVLLGDFNMTIENPKFSECIHTYNLSSLIKEPTCFKSITNPSCIDLILTNCKNLFMKSRTYETGYLISTN